MPAGNGGIVTFFTTGNVILAGGPGLFKSIDSGQTWKDIGAGLPFVPGTGAVAGIAADTSYLFVSGHTSTAVTSTIVWRRRLSELGIAPFASAPGALTPPVGSILADSTVTLDWDPLDHAAGYSVRVGSYHLQVAADPTFSDSLIINDSSSAARPRSITAPIGDRKFYWRVRTIPAAGGVNGEAGAPGAWSRVSSFTTGSISTSGIESPASISRAVSVRCSPNPASSRISIECSLPVSGPVRLTLANLLGVEVATISDAQMSAGSHTFSFDAGGLPPGRYLLRLQSGALGTSTPLLLVDR